MTDSKIGYRERSLWASLFAVALVDTLYFVVVLYGWWLNEPLGAGELLVLLVVITGVLLAIEMAFVLSNRAQREPMDERDELIAAKAARLAYVVFVVGVLLAVVLHLLATKADGEPLFGLPLVEVHLILASLVSSELVRYGHALQHYRAGY